MRTELRTSDLEIIHLLAATELNASQWAFAQKKNYVKRHNSTSFSA